MEVIVVRDEHAGAQVVADLIVDLVVRTPRAVLGLATGRSPVPTYDELIRRYRRGEVSFAGCTGFLLDEYVGLSRSDDRSFTRVIEAVFTGQVDFAPGAMHVPDTEADDPNEEAVRYERAIIDAGGIDLQVLGIGRDAHIGFNEPMSSLASRSRVKTLMRQSVLDNAGWVGEPVPSQAITQGVATILDSRHAVLIAHGESKSEAIAAAIEGPLSARVPASALQLHPHVTFVVDDAAASRLQYLEYYRDIQQAKAGTAG